MWKLKKMKSAVKNKITKDSYFNGCSGTHPSLLREECFSGGIGTSLKELPNPQKEQDSTPKNKTGATQNHL